MGNQHYFSRLNQSLQKWPSAIPRLLIDLDILDQNIEVFRSELRPGANFRLVVKSLPAPRLIHYLLDKLDARRLMVFHEPFLRDLSAQLDQGADILLGKPMPISTAGYYYDQQPKANNNFNPFKQVQWLIDTKKRLGEYLDLAKKLQQPLSVNLEIDVGLHRGGFKSLDELRTALDLIDQNQQHLDFSGLMGYDPHLAKIPSILRSQAKGLELSNQFYRDCQQMIRTSFPALWQDELTFNGAGSPTLNLHSQEDSPLNDVAAGSCFLKPTTFDIASLKEYQPACFIATPVLKKLVGTNIPGLESIQPVLNRLPSSSAHSFFIYGGYWKADFVYPIGAKLNHLFGPSTNQSLVNVPDSDQLSVDDFIFLRPQQSEFVLLQFGKLLITRGAKILEEWDILQQ